MNNQHDGHIRAKWNFEIQQAALEVRTAIEFHRAFIGPMQIIDNGFFDAWEKVGELQDEIEHKTKTYKPESSLDEEATNRLKAMLGKKLSEQFALLGLDANGTKVHDCIPTSHVIPAPAQTPAPVGAASDGPVKPVQRSAAQDATVLAEIEKQGLKPLALPKNQPGKKGVKADIRASLAGTNLFPRQGKTFDRAWERLTKNADIVIKK